MNIKIFDEIHWQLFPETEDMVEVDIDMNTLARIGIDKCFDLEKMKVVDYVNPRIEYDDIKKWFDVDYARLEQKYRRLNDLNKKCDDGSLPYDKLINLYNEAEIKRHRIQELEKLINDI